jgi:hypothetical protein
MEGINHGDTRRQHRHCTAATRRAGASELTQLLSGVPDLVRTNTNHHSIGPCTIPIPAGRIGDDRFCSS